MNQKTDAPANGRTPTTSEFSSEFICWLVSLTGATLLLVYLFEQSRFFGLAGVSRVTILPWIKAAGLTIAQGLREFNGLDPTVPSDQRISLLVALLTGFVIGPTLLLFGWRRTRIEQESGEHTKLLRASSLAFMFGGMLTFAAVIPVLPTSIVSRAALISLQRAQTVQSNKDAMMDDINFIAHHAMQYWILPKESGGGNRSFVGYVIPEPMVQNDQGSYSLSHVAPDFMVITAVSKQREGDKISVTFESADKLSYWNFEGKFQ